MHRFTVVQADQNLPPAEFVAADAASVIYLVSRLKCGEADVFEDGCYQFSLRVNGAGLWCIFQRDEDGETDAVGEFG